jgi:predicted TIM-barrel fold metal-dependent hydrolase
MSDRLTIISADGHCGASSSAAYREYFDAKYHDQVDDYLEHRVGYLFEDVMLEGEMREHWKQQMAESALAVFDPDERIKVLESEGIVAEVLYPDGSRDNEVPFVGSGTGLLGGSAAPDELVFAAQWAYNRWLADFCSAHPERFGGLVAIQMKDVDRAVETVQWAAAQPGIRGVLVPGIDPSLPPYFSTRFDPIWAACVDADLPISVHVGAGSAERGLGNGLREELEAGGASLLITVGELAFFAHRPLWFLIAGGVLDRFPTLKVALTEQYSDWIPRVLAYFDWAYKTTPFKGVRSIKHAPSEYWDRQCFVGASTPSRQEAEMRHEIGIDTMMYGMDFPHYEGTWGRTRPFIQTTFGRAGTTPKEARKLFAENAAACYGFDIARLDDIAQRVGSTPDELLTPCDVDENDPAWALAIRPLSV